MPRDLALRQVQLDSIRGELRGGGPADTAESFYWAGLCFYGDTRLLLLNGNRRRSLVSDLFN